MENLSLQSENIFLRLLEPEDVSFLQQVENDPMFWAISQTVQPFTKYTLSQYIEQAHQDIYECKQQRWVICSKEDHRCLGFLDLFDFDPRNARVGLGIVIASETERRKNYASEAISLIINYCFHHLYVRQIFVNILTDNTSSIALFSKFGFELVGVKKQWIRVNHQFKDEALYQLIQQDL